jgi:hypothetical protein
LLLRAALLDGVGARSAWEDWRRTGGDIETVDTATFRLLPLVYRNLEANRVDDPDIPRLKGVYRHAWVKNQHLAHCLEPALESLKRAGIPAMLLKGAAVSVVHYRDAGARRMDDVGVLVPPPEAERALAVFRASGWSMLGRIDPRRTLRSRHAMALREPGGAQIDLQWRVLPESIRDDDFWSGAVPAKLGRAATLAPGPTEQLLHTCAFGMRAGPDALTWIADAAVIIRGARAEIDWARLVEGVAQREIALRTTTSLAKLCELLAAPIPYQVMSALNALPSGARERLLLRLSLRPSPITGFVELWDMYRRRVAAADDGYVYRDFLQYVADANGLPSRRAIGSRLARRAISLASASSRSRLRIRP